MILEPYSLYGNSETLTFIESVSHLDEYETRVSPSMVNVVYNDRLDKELIKQAETKVKYHDAIPGEMIGYKIPSVQDEKIKKIEKICNNIQSGTFETLLLYSKYNSNFLRKIHFIIQSICKK